MAMSRIIRVAFSSLIALPLAVQPLGVLCSADEKPAKPPVVDDQTVDDQPTGVTPNSDPSTQQIEKRRAADADRFHGLQEVNSPPSPPVEQVIAIVGGLLIDGRGGAPHPRSSACSTASHSTFRLTPSPLR